MVKVTAQFVVIGMVLALGQVIGCGGDSLPDNERLERVFADGETGVWVSGHGTVSQMPSDEAGASPAQRLVVRINDGLSVVVRHELEYSGRVPAEKSDIVAFQGRYTWDGRGGIVAYTYADEDQPGGGGWIQHAGIRYD